MFVLICSTLYPICVDDLRERPYTFIVAGPDHFSIKPLDTQAFPDAVSVIGAYLDVWPYARPLGHGLVTYWQSLASFQPEHFWVAYRDRIAQACLHGEVVAAQGLMHIHLLALRPGAMEMAIALLIDSQDQMPVVLGLMYLRGRAGTTGGRMGVLMGGALIGTIPMLILYFMGQKYFVQGIARTGLKG